VLQKAELSAQADSENNLGGSSETYVLHRTRCTQEDDQLLRERRGWPCTPGGQDWINSPRTGRLDSNYAASKKKNDRIDAGKIADCVRCDFLPECHMASTEIRDRRRTLRYQNLVIKQMVQMKNRVSGLLMETGVSYNKQRLHKVGYFAELMTTNEEVHESVRPLLKLSRDMISRSQKLDYALVSSLQRDPALKERLRRLRTVPGVGPITALTWALEIGDYTRFSSAKRAISYCGLCGDEKSSADKVMRMPISKQRNKHIQQVLIEAAKLAPSESHELALTHARELERGNRNRATLAVARKMVCYMLAVERRQQDFVPAEEFSRTIAV
jgi:transposase